jgi:hypothetical protein
MALTEKEGQYHRCERAVASFEPGHLRERHDFDVREPRDAIDEIAKHAATEARSSIALFVSIAQPPLLLGPVLKIAVEVLDPDRAPQAHVVVHKVVDVIAVAAHRKVNHAGSQSIGTIRPRRPSPSWRGSSVTTPPASTNSARRTGCSRRSARRSALRRSRRNSGCPPPLERLTNGERGERQVV